MINTKDAWVVEYNSQQNKFHIQELETTLRSNLEDAKKGISSGAWPIIGIFPDHRSAGDFVQETRSNKNLF
jgi:hypothetical protein